MTTVLTELATRAEANAHDVQSDSSPSGKEMARRKMVRFDVPALRVEADSAAGTTIAERSLLQVPASEFPNGAKVVEISLRTSAVVSESTSLYATDTFTSRDSAGVSNLVAATLKTDTVANGGIGTTVAHKKYTATLSATVANRVIPADGVLTLTRAKASTGTQLPECTYCVVLEAL